MTKQTKPGKRTEHFLPYITTLLVFVGCSLLLYPHAAQWVSQYQQVEITRIYETRVHKAEPKANVQQQNALEYNRQLLSGGLLEANKSIPTANENFGTEIKEASVLPYEKQLDVDGHGLMSRIRISKVDIDLPVYHGTREDTLLRGAGHLQGTSLPIGGEGTRTVITAHRGLAGSRMFTDLDELDIGDTFIIETLGEILTYKVIEKVVVEPDDRETVRPVQGKDLATLVTCTPLGINSHRILVTGERVTPTPVEVVEDLKAPSPLPRFPWWLVFWIISALPLLGYSLFLVVAFFKRRNSAKKHEETASEQSV